MPSLEKIQTPKKQALGKKIAVDTFLSLLQTSFTLHLLILIVIIIIIIVIIIILLLLLILIIVNI